MKSLLNEFKWKCQIDLERVIPDFKRIRVFLIKINYWFNNFVTVTGRRIAKIYKGLLY
jgi:hypothetical protein